ncbi:hypothetical protein [Phosphitispora sp. TUW77]|uniref:hypothetical protein n=1 Tax=Phosphitispora sp. TUW77 TaxID=3152361 RepID=UPI003AB157E8
MIKLSLCKKGCCPEVHFAEGNFIIKDDMGGKVTLTPAQIKILVEKYQELQNEMHNVGLSQ